MPLSDISYEKLVSSPLTIATCLIAATASPNLTHRYFAPRWIEVVTFIFNSLLSCQLPPHPTGVAEKSGGRKVISIFDFLEDWVGDGAPATPNE